jgi:hypothetical protein
VGVALVCVGVVAGAAALVHRFRRAHGEERQRLSWIALAAAVLAVAALFTIGSLLLGLADWLASLPLMVAYICVPVFTGTAILRHRLFEIDVILNRGFVLTLLTGFVTLAYVVLVVLVSAVVTPSTAGSFWPSLLVTAVVALAFQPLRRRTERLADRIVYGEQAVPYVALAEFSRGLQEAPGTDDLVPRVAEAVGRVVGARHVQVWVELPGPARPTRSAAGWPDDRRHEPDLLLPVTDDGAEIGGVAVTMPPGRALRTAEEQLLRDFTAQLAYAFRSVRLREELALRVAELDRQTRELAASGRRLASAQAAERERFEAAIRHVVLPHLARLPDTLRQMQHATATGRAPLGRIDAAGAGATEALEVLRTLAHGVFPAQLAHRGLLPALASHLADAGHHGVLRADPALAGRRFDPRVESTAYFCAVGLLGQLDRPEAVTVSVVPGTLALTVTGTGAAAVASAGGHPTDRVAALGGTTDVDTAGERVTFRLRLPLASAAGVAPDPGEAVAVER